MSITPGYCTTRDPSLHPWAWWCWALCLAFAVSLTTNPLFLVLLAFGMTTVILLRRSDAPWARSVGAYFVLAGSVIAIRVFFQIVVGRSYGATVLFRLPDITLPAWAAGIRLGGAVTAEAVAFTVYDGLRLATMLLCLGAANALANPKVALRSVPAALYEASTAIVIALSVAPQLIESAQRVRRARRLRGGPTSGWHAVTAVLIPVLEDAIERSMALAASMESRGFGRTSSQTGGKGPAVLLISSLLVLTCGGYLLLGAADALWLGVCCLVTGATGVGVGLHTAGQRLRVTRYRPAPWQTREWLVCLCGLGTAALAVALNLMAYDLVHPGTDPLVWPDLHPLMLTGVVLTILPIVITRAPTVRTTPGVRDQDARGPEAVPA